LSRIFPKKQINEKLIGFLISPYLIAFPIALIIVLFLPPIQKYKIELVKKGVSDKPDSFETYCDINKDGFSEKIILFNNQKGDAAIKVVDQSGALLGWYDFTGKIYKDTPACGDYDHDGYPEIYFISDQEDSVFLNILCPGMNTIYTTKQRFVTLLHIRDRNEDYSAGTWQFCDLQLDGTDEVLFYIFAGYSLQPRRFYGYDLKNDSLFSSPLMGSKTSFIAVQLDDDPYLEFLGQTSSTGNMSSDMDIPYNDSSSWLMALDHELHFIFNPIEFKGHKTVLESQPLKMGNVINILSLFEFSSVHPWKPALMLFDNQGNLKAKKEIEKPTGQEYYTLLYHKNPDEDLVLLKDVMGQVYQVDKHLNLNKIGQVPENCFSKFETIDLDQDGADELVFLSNDCERLYITRNDFSQTSEAKVSFERTAAHISEQKNGTNASFLFLQRGERELWLSYRFNKLWYAKFPIWLGIYFLVLGFTHIIRKFQIIQQNKVKAREEQLAELQLGSVSTYIDPHFTFNTLNTITSLIYKEDRNKAHEVITRFTSLIRVTLMQSGKITRTLGDELEFVKDYLAIQQFRFGNIFTWEIRNENNVDLSLLVPKMLVQQYAENAIKHGLKNKGEGGRIDIILLRQNKETMVVIRDNGVGREKAKSINEPGTGKGLITMQQIFDLFEKTNKIKISQTINDLFDEKGKPAGTEIVLLIS
jgi:hypothetical protein